MITLRVPWWLWLLLALASAIVALAHFAAESLPLLPTEKRLELQASLRRDGEVLVASLFAVRSVRGRYPESIEQVPGVGRLPTLTMWRYMVTPDGKECGLGAGEYFRHGFELRWWSEGGGSWHLDN